MDGWITIGTKLDSKQLQRDLVKTENELKKFERQAQKLTEQEAKIKTKIEFDDQDYKNKINRLENRLKNELEVNTTGGIIKNEDSIRAKYDDLFQRLEETQEMKSTKNNLQLEEIHQKMEENTKEQERLNNKIQETENLLNKAKGSFDLKGTIENVGKSISNVTKKVVRWGLAIFGVRSAYYFVRQAMSTIAQYDDQLATDIQYIRFALAMTLKPLIEEIIKLVYKLLSLIGYIGQKIFGKNIFENSGINEFQKTLNSSSKSAEKLKKTLAGFDEMNILNEDGSVSGFGGSNKTPSFDLSEIGDTEPIGIQKWLKKVEKMFRSTFEKIRKNVVKVMKGLGFSQDYIDAFNLTVDGIEDIFGGLGLFIKGFGETVVGLLTGDIKLVKKGFEDMGKGIKLTFKGLLEMLGGIFMQIVYLVRDSFRKLPEIIYELFIKKGNKSFEEFKTETKLKFRNIVDSIGSFFGELPSIIINALNPFNFVSAFNKFTNAWNEMIRGLTKDIKINISSAGGGSGAWGGGSGGGGFRAKGGIYYPKLAVGGIINMPGRGVPYHGATIGERGAEAVVPLTDSQQMALLGEAIGKYITVNATIVNSMNGRVLNRELQKIQNQSSFATNGR